MNVMEYGEAVQNKQRSIEEQIFRLETSVAANLSLVTNYSRYLNGFICDIKILSLFCSNLDKFWIFKQSAPTMIVSEMS